MHRRLTLGRWKLELWTGRNRRARAQLARGAVVDQHAAELTARLTAGLNTRVLLHPRSDGTALFLLDADALRNHRGGQQVGKDGAGAGGALPHSGRDHLQRPGPLARPGPTGDGHPRTDAGNVGGHGRQTRRHRHRRRHAHHPSLPACPRSHRRAVGMGHSLAGNPALRRTLLQLFDRRASVACGRHHAPQSASSSIRAGHRGVRRRVESKQLLASGIDVASLPGLARAGDGRSRSARRTGGACAPICNT